MMSEFKELEIETFDLGGKVDQEQLQEMLRRMNGVKMARITRSGVHIMYNPLGITPEEIARAIRQSGVTIAYEQPG